MPRAAWCVPIDSFGPFTKTGERLLETQRLTLALSITYVLIDQPVSSSAFSTASDLGPGSWGPEDDDWLHNPDKSDGVKVRRRHICSEALGAR